MKEIKIFISYMSNDNNKARSFARELEARPTLDPIIVVNKREPRSLFADKVKKAIEESDYVVPIITKNSLDSQWVNQEIGFAEAKEKIVFPIIDKKCLQKLKGFIHKEEEHFIFNSSTDKAKESRDFRKIFRLLIEHILAYDKLPQTSRSYHTAITQGNNRTTLDYHYELTRKSKFLLTVKLSLIDQAFVVHLKVITSEKEEIWIGFSNLEQVVNKFDQQHVFKLSRKNSSTYSISEHILGKIDESGIKIKGTPVSVEAIRFRGAESLGSPIHYYYSITEK